VKFTATHSLLAPGCESSALMIHNMGEGESVDLYSLDYIRSAAQNRKMWPVLTDIALHVEWFGRKHDAETWKHILSAAWRKQEFVHGITETLVVLPVRTSGLNKAEFAEFLTMVMAFGDEHGVPWSDPSLALYATYKEAA